MRNKLKPDELWCFCPQCSRLLQSDKPWKNPNCTVCGNERKIAVNRMCSKGHGELKEICFWCAKEEAVNGH